MAAGVAAIPATVGRSGVSEDSPERGERRTGFDFAGAVGHCQAPSEAGARGNRAEGGGGKPPQHEPGSRISSMRESGACGRGGTWRDTTKREDSNGRQLLDTAAAVRSSGATGGGPIVLASFVIRRALAPGGSQGRPVTFLAKRQRGALAEFARGSSGNSAQEPFPPPWPRMVRPAR